MSLNFLRFNDDGLTVYDFGLNNSRITLATESDQIAVSTALNFYSMVPMMVACFSHELTPMKLFKVKKKGNKFVANGKEITKFFGCTIQEFFYQNTSKVSDAYTSILPGGADLRKQFWGYIKELKVSAHDEFDELTEEWRKKYAGFSDLTEIQSK